METAPSLRLSTLTRARPTDIEIAPTAEECAALAQDLGLDGLRKLRLSGRLIPEGRADWRLEAHLGATVVQPCAVTLAPVTTRIDEAVTRRYIADLGADTAQDEEAEIPEDDSVEALPQRLDLDAVLAEALALALPLFPRAPGASLDETQAAPPGVAPLTDADTKPLAALGALKDSLFGTDDGGAPGDEPKD